MRAVVQRVTSSKVVVDGQITGAINKGINVLIGISCDDNEEDLKYIRDKIINFRIFEVENFKMNKSLMDIGGEILVISQFTLYGDCRKGRRPTFMAALGGEDAKKLYDKYGCMACEMESFALFHNAKKFGKKAAQILTVTDNLITGERASSENRQNDVMTMIEIAMESVIKL